MLFIFIPTLTEFGGIQRNFADFKSQSIQYV